MASAKPNLAAEQKALEELQKKVEQARARVKQAKIAELKAQAQAARKLDSQKKLLIGVSILESIKRGEWTESDLMAVVDRGLTRENERAVFGLPPGRPLQPPQRAAAGLVITKQNWPQSRASAGFSGASLPSSDALRGTSKSAITLFCRSRR